MHSLVVTVTAIVAVALQAANAHSLFSSALVDRVDQLVFQPSSSLDDTKLWELCDEPEKHLLTPTRITLVPAVPTTGEDLSVEVELDSKRTVSNGKVHAELQLGFIKLTKDVDMCQALQDYTVDTKCPLTEGHHTIRVR